MNATKEAKAPHPLTVALASLGVTMEASAPSAGVDKADGKEGKAWPHIAYTVTLSRNGKVFWSGPYKLGVGHVALPKTVLEVRKAIGCLHSDALAHKVEVASKGRTVTYTPEIEAGIAAYLARTQKVSPTLLDVFNSLLSDGSPEFDAEDFEGWAGNFGYDTDSRKAFGIYQACCEVGKALRRAFKPAEIETLRKAAQDY